MHIKPSAQTSIPGLVLLLAITGCGTQGANVTGTVTLDGEPLSTGTVTFYPVEQGQPAYGTIDANGHYEMRVTGENGLVPGKYRIAVVSIEPAMAPASGDLPKPGASLIPRHYGNLQASGLQYEARKGEQGFDITLISPLIQQE